MPHDAARDVDGEKQPRVSASIPPAMYEALEWLAAKEVRSKSWLVASAVSEFLERKRESHPDLPIVTQLRIPLGKSL